jgi:hypothetical protein
MRLLFTVIFSIIFFVNSVAQGDLMIFPKRLVFEGTQKRAQTLYLSNNGDDIETYRVSYTEIRMGSKGQFETIKLPDPGQRFASPYLRVYPRTITLAPNEAQVVKVQLTKTNELKPGEYRSHLYFRAVPKTKSDQKNKETNDKERFDISLTPVYGVSIANIIQIGEPEVDVSLSDLNFKVLKNNVPIISMNFNRQGKYSVYGNFRIYHTSKKGKETEVAVMKGFAVYVPSATRNVRVKLNTSKNVDYSSGLLKVIYTSHAEGEIYATELLNLKSS